MAEGVTVESFFAPDGVLASGLPRFEHRPSQIRMATAVWECFRDSGCLMVEAGTGTGKTFAYLVPALLSGRKTVISTATKALQDQILDHDLPVLIRRFFPKARVRSLKGRKNYLCLRRFKEFAYQPSFWNREEAALFGALHEWAARTKTGDRSERTGSRTIIKPGTTSRPQPTSAWPPSALITGNASSKRAALRRPGQIFSFSTTISSSPHSPSKNEAPGIFCLRFPR